MATLKTYDLFISHSWTYGDAYEKLSDFLSNASNFSWRNYSVPKDDPIHDADSATELYEAIKGQISPANIVIIMAGKYATYSKWIKKEIKIAQTEFSNAKPILAVAPWGSQQISSVVSEAADEISAWNTNSIVGAIRRLAI